MSSSQAFSRSSSATLFIIHTSGLNQCIAQHTFKRSLYHVSYLLKCISSWRSIIKMSFSFSSFLGISTAGAKNPIKSGPCTFAFLKTETFFLILSSFLTCSTAKSIFSSVTAISNRRVEYENLRYAPNLNVKTATTPSA